MVSRENEQDTSGQSARPRAQRILANSGAGEERFAEPRGWALRWDGASLPEDRDVEDGEALSRARRTG